MNNMPQNGPVDQGEHEKNSTNVVSIDSAKEHKCPVNSYVGLTLEDMEQRFVFLTQTSSVYDKLTGETFNSFAAFSDAYAGCYEMTNKGRVGIASQWKVSPNRITRRNITFSPGEGEEVREGNMSFINTWRKIPVSPVANARDGQPVVDLINALFTDQADDFLDGLAAHWQHPEKAFQHAWLQISEQTGTGRGSLTMALNAVWQGELAVLDDLSPFQSGKGVFSDRIIGKTFYVVEEMMSISDNKYRVVANLNNVVTSDSLWINPKGEKGYEQKHRAFIFIQSNELDCMPILAKDSRWKVAYYKGDQSFSNEWFVNFREQCKADSAMIHGFRQLLAERDIRHYNFGRVRNVSAAKKLVQDETKSALQQALEAIVDNWQCAYLPTSWVKILLADSKVASNNDAAISKTLKEIGCHAMKEPVRLSKTTRVRCWVLPGHDNRKGVKEELSGFMARVFGTVPVALNDTQICQMYAFEEE